MEIFSHIRSPKCSKARKDSESVLGTKITTQVWDKPGGPVVKNLPSNAGDEGSAPGQGQDPTCSGATKPVSHSYRARVPQLETQAPLVGPVRPDQAK